jgi:hypothetical protein
MFAQNKKAKFGLLILENEESYLGKKVCLY